ncbi:MAG: type IV pilus assembly protein PilQ [Bacteroidetes bacterium]|nr:MAG: type IV pilus assembly protein PilQ [Bacteroidota bacterium]
MIKAPPPWTKSTGDASHRPAYLKCSIFRFAAIILLLIIFHSPLSAQDRFTAIEQKLKTLSAETPGLNNKVDFSVNGVTIQEFIRGLAVSNNLNVSVEPSLNVKIFNNFSNVTVSDVLIFLCKKYELDITFIGNIMAFSQYTAPPPPVIAPPKKLPKITWDADKGLLSFDLSNDSLPLVARELTRVTKKNIVYSPEIGNKMLNGYIEAMPVDAALDKLAFSNDIKVTPGEDNFFLLEKKDKEKQGTGSGTGGGNKNTALPAGLSLKITGGLINIEAISTPIGDIVGAVSKELGYDFFLFSEIKGNTTMKMQNATYEEFLKNIFNGTDFTYKKQDNLYLIGDRNLEGLRMTKVVQLRYRTVDKMTDFIPADLKKNVDLKIFPDLNSLILSGSQPRIEEIEAFLRDVDRVVPVVLIEVIIMDVSNTHTLSTGIEAGLKNGSTPPSQNTVMPGVDVTFDANAINSVISGINGLGIINLGKVGPDFYVRLRALEEQGMLKVRSTPKLSTLNGNEAKMSIGRTEYYLEESNNVIGSQNPQNIITRTFKPVTADLAITINPMVSGDEQITMDRIADPREEPGNGFARRTGRNEHDRNRQRHAVPLAHPGDQMAVQQPHQSQVEKQTGHFYQTDGDLLITRINSKKI